MQSTFQLLLLSIFVSIQSFAQKNSLVAIPGTHCSMLPPEGFVIADRFTGFQNNSTGATIMVTEFTVIYSKLITSLTPEAFLKQQMIITNTEKIQYNGTDATLFTASQSQGGLEYNKLILVFGSGSQTIMVNGIFPVSADQLEKPIRAAIFTTKFVDGALNEAAPLFTVSTDGTSFKKVSTLGTVVTYSTDSLSPMAADSPVLIISNSVGKIANENRKSYAESRIMTLPRGDQNKIKSTTPISIDGLEGYEILAEGVNQTGSPQTIYQVILYNTEGDYYILVGIAAKDVKNQLKEFKKITGTFKLRES